jgi:hypothetical protein
MLNNRDADAVEKCGRQHEAEGIDGSSRGLAQQMLELGEDLFDGVQVGRIFG